MAISWKWSHLAQKWPTRQIWGCFQHLRNFSKSGDAAVCLINFENFISFKPGRSGSSSSWQCCRTQLVLQLCQLHHLLTRFGLEVALSDDQRRVWIGAELVDVADRRQSFVDICRPYVALGPARQLPAHAWPPRRRPGRSGRVHSFLPLTLSPEKRPQWAHSGELNHAHAMFLLTKTHPQLHREPLSILHPLTRRETLGWADISNFPQIRSPWPSSPVNSMPSSLKPLVFSG